MKRLLPILSLLIAGLLSTTAWAVPVCTAVNFSASTSGASATQTMTLPTGHAAGDLLLIIDSSRGAETVSTPPTGYTLMKASAAGGFVVYGKIDSGSESAPSLTWSSTNMHSGFMLALRSSTGWASIGSIVVDSVTGTSTQTIMRYRSLTVSANNLCAVQVGSKNTTTALSTPTVNVTSGYTAGGIGFNNSASSVITSAQFQSQTTATNLTQNDETINGNTDSTTATGISFTLLMSTAVPTFTSAPTIGTRTTSSIPINFTSDTTGNVYGVRCTAGSTAPTAAEVVAGQCHGGGAAIQAWTEAVTANVADSHTFGSITDGTTTDGYFVASDGGTTYSTVASIASMYKLPAFTVNPTVSSCGTGGCTLGFTLDGPGTVYGVACKAGSTAATVTEVETAKCTGGATAQASANKSVTGADTLVVGTSLTLPEYDFGVAAVYGSQHEASTHAITNRVLTPPSSGCNGAPCQYIVLTSIGTGSPVAAFNAATSPAVVAGDILVAPTLTHPSNFALTATVPCPTGGISSDGQINFCGDTSRQDILGIKIYDYSAQAFHADTIDFWVNNLAPTPPPTDSVSFNWEVGIAITPIDLTTYCPDPEGDAVTVTAVSGLAGGMSITANILSGTPTTAGISTLTLRCTDVTGDYVDWH